MHLARLVFVCVLSFSTKTSLQNTQVKRGNVGCSLLGIIEEQCNRPDVHFNQLPKACTSYFYHSIGGNVDYNVGFFCNRKANKAYFSQFLKDNNKQIPTYIYYGYSNIQTWSFVLTCNNCEGSTNVEDEINAMKAFFTQYQGISGIVLENLEYNDFITTPFYGFTEYFITYINGIKNEFQDFEVAITICAKFILDYFGSDQPNEWLDINKIMPLLDFIVIDFTCFNKCTKGLECGGVVPVDGNGPYTMKKLNDMLIKLCIPKDKVYYYYQPQPMPPDQDDMFVCDMTYKQVCQNKSATATWCSETTESLVEKGKYALENSNGFIVDNVDMDFFTKLDCKCKDDYPTLQYLLDGYQNKNPNICPLYNRL